MLSALVQDFQDPPQRQQRPTEEEEEEEEEKAIKTQALKPSISRREIP